MEYQTDTLNWLMAGDPSIRWQTLRDLCEEPPETYQAERSRIENEGWGAQLLVRQDPDGKWAGGIYSPKWTSTTYTMLHLRQLGLPSQNNQAARACAHLVEGVYHDGGINYWKSMHHSETCVSGMILALLAYFNFPDERIHRLPEFLLSQQMADGGWNCDTFKGATHASFHTTLSALEGLDEYARTYPQFAPAVREGAHKAEEFLLHHRIYKSCHSDHVADPAMTRMYFPPRWRYDFIRALDYFQGINAPKDPRFQEAVDLLLNKQGKDGRWILNTPWAGRTFFTMEKTDEPSRWNTLRALRVLKWWQSN